MRKTLNIVSRQPIDGFLTDITKEIPFSELDYICFETSGKKEERPRYFLSIKSKANISVVDIANWISDWILKDFECSFAKDIFNERFCTFYDSEANKIVETALNERYHAEKLYDKKLIVKSLTKYLDDNESISIDGFLRFRSKAYKKRLEEYLYDAAEEFWVKQEYNDFLKLIKLYLDECESKIGLVHIRLNADGNFLLYDLKKTEISVKGKDFDFCKECFSKDTELLSVLLALNPKRIIWHTNCLFDDTTLVSSIKEVFQERFTECNGCEFCIKK